MKFHDESILLNRSGSTHFILSVDRRWKGRPIQWSSRNFSKSKLEASFTFFGLIYRFISERSINKIKMILTEILVHLRFVRISQSIYYKKAIQKRFIFPKWKVNYSVRLKKTHYQCLETVPMILYRLNIFN